MIHKSPKQVLVWSLFVRITHWLVAVSIVINSFNETDGWHRFIGYTAVILVLIRLAVGLVNRYRAWNHVTAYASRLWWPRLDDIKQHLREMWSGHLVGELGHNPLGQLAAYAMWGLIVALAFTGWLSRTDMFWGEDWPVDSHHWLSMLLQGLVILHICAVIVMSRLQKQNLVMAMLNGKKSKTE